MLMMLDKMSFHGVLIHMCLNVSFFLFAWMGKCYRCHHAFLDAYSQSFSTTRMANRSMTTEAAIRPHVKSRWKGAECKSGWKTAPKQNRRNCRLFRCVWLVCMCGVFFFSLSQESQWSGGGDWSAYQNERLQQFPATPTVITSIPRPSVFLAVLTQWNDVMHHAVWLIRRNWSV